MLKRLLLFFVFCTLLLLAAPALTQDVKEKKEEPAKVEAPKTREEIETEKVKARAAELTKDINQADTAWMMVSTAFVLFMVPGLALFYAGMVRRKNVLATMMHSMVALAVVGVFWVAIGYSLAFGDPLITVGTMGSVLGFSKKLVFMQGVNPYDVLPGNGIPVYLHMAYQGMFAIITPALISGAIAERIRFKPYCLFLILWITLVYCPLAHAVWAMDFWTAAADAGTNAVGILGKMSALDFAGGTVVHIAAGFSALAAILILPKRVGYPEHAMHPNSMVLTLTGAGLLWFGWFGFNAGSGLQCSALATTAFIATQCGAAAGGLIWMVAEWVQRGKPTALGLASGIVAGLVAVTPAAGFVLPCGGLAIGAIAGIVCYLVVTFKPKFGYDDSLDAFGVHGVGGFLGAVLTGVFCYQWDFIYPLVGQPGMLVNGDLKQVEIQLIAATGSAVLAFVVSAILIKVIDVVIGFMVTPEEETQGLDQIEHGEAGFDFGYGYDTAPAISSTQPKSAIVPPVGSKFHVIVEGAKESDLIKVWSDLCQPSATSAPEFKAVYPFVTTVQGNRFKFRGGDQNAMKENLKKLFEKSLKCSLQVKIEA